MNAELSLFKNEEHNYESASTLERDVTPSLLGIRYKKIPISVRYWRAIKISNDYISSY